MRGDAMRGLAVFISDIRNCKKIDNEIHQFNYALHLGKSREAELRRINKELTNIRQRFRSRRSFSQYFRIFSSTLRTLKSLATTAFTAPAIINDVLCDFNFE